MALNKNKIIKYFLIVFSCLTLTFLLSNTYTAQAATKFVKSDGSKVTGTIYINNYYTLMVNNQSAYFYSNNTSVASISKTSGKLTLKVPGKVTIRAYNRRTGKLAVKKTFTVRRRTDYLTTTSKTATIVTGGTKKLSVTKNPTWASDVLYFKSSNASVATVNSSTGLVTGIASGTATITCYSKASASTPLTSTHMRKLTFKVTVNGKLSSALQTAKDEVTVTFDSAPSTVAPSQFTVTSSAGKALTAASASISTANSKQCILKFNEPILDGLKYTVKYYTSSKTFTASNGVISKFVISPTTIPINTDTAVSASAYDSNGMYLDEYTYGNTYDNITFTVTSSYLTTSKQLKFTAKKQTATARIIYYTTVNGVKTTKADSGNVTITSYDDTAANTTFLCNLSNDSSYTFPAVQTSEYNTNLPTGSYDYRAYFKFIGNTGNEITDYSIYHVASSNNSIFTASGTLSNNVKYVNIYPVAKGTAYLYVKDSTNDIVHTFTITVMDPLTPTTLTLSSYSVQLSHSSSNSMTVTFDVLDQLGNTMPTYTQVNKTTLNGATTTSSLTTITCVSTSATGVTASMVNSDTGESYYSFNSGSITFFGNNLTIGTYYYQITAGTLTKTIAVTIY